MDYEIVKGPSYALAEVKLAQGESIVAESGAMAWMEGGIKTVTSAKGGILKGLKRKLLAGESFFQNTFIAEEGPGMIGLAPGMAGDIIPVQLSGQELILEKGAYLASTEGIDVDSKFDGFAGMFNEGFFVLKVSGTGLLFFSGYGDIQEVQVNGSYVVDNGYAVAWEPTLQYNLTKTGRGIRSFLFGDQLVLNFQGQGKLWIQSRSPRSFAAWVHPFRPVKSDNN